MPAPQRNVLIEVYQLTPHNSHGVMHVRLANKERTPLVSLQVDLHELRERLWRPSEHVGPLVHAEIVSPKR